MIKRSFTIDKQIRQNGDFDSVVLEIVTGEATDALIDRYKLTIEHSLGRTPIGVSIIWSDDFINCKVIDADKSKIILQFNKERTKVRLEIW